jgi:hypothetical protein
MSEDQLGSIALTAVQPLGPWAHRAGAPIPIGPLEWSFRNRGQATIELSGAEVEPLRRAGDGGRVAARLWVERPAGSGDEDSLRPGEVGTLRLRGEGRLAPGRFETRLALKTADSGQAFSVPVAVVVRAHWLWAFAFVVLGLAFVGLLLFLGGRATLNERLAEALTEQQDLHELLESSPPVLADRRLARQAKESVASAVESLTRPRPLSFEDPRLTRAERHLERARAAAAALRARAGDQSPGRLAMEELETVWAELVKSLKGTRKHLRPQAATAVGVDEGDLVPLLQAVQLGQWRQRVVPLLATIEQSLGPQVERARLALTAGEEERARRLAQLVTLWLQRAARQLDKETELLLTWRTFAGEMLARDALLERSRNDPELPEAARQRLGGSLDAARRLLRPTTLEGFRDAARELQEAEKELLRRRSEQLIERVRDAIAAVDERTSLERIEAALDQFSTDEPKQDRVTRMLGVLQLWRERVASVEEAERQRFLERITGLEELLEADDLQASGPAFKELLDAWTRYQQAQTEQAMASVIVPYCRQQLPAMRSQQLGTMEALALLQPRSDLEGLDEALDRISVELEKGFSESACLDRLVDLSGELMEIGNRLFGTFLLVADISREQRLASAEYSGVVEAVTLARRLMQEPRPLRLELRTPPAEIHVDRTVVLEAGDLDPAWGSGLRCGSTSATAVRLWSATPRSCASSHSSSISTPGRNSPRCGSRRCRSRRRRSSIREARSSSARADWRSPSVPRGSPSPARRRASSSACVSPSPSPSAC